MSRSRTRTTRLFLKALPITGCLLTLLSPEQAHADHVDRSRLSVMHLNIAGAVTHHGNTGIADKLADSVASRAPGLPLAVSVNEVCIQQWSRLYDRLTALGYTGHFGPSLWTTAEDRCGKDKPFGNAIFWLGGHADAATFWIDDENMSEGDTNLVCGLAHFPANTWYCSTHLLPNLNKDGTYDLARLAVTRRQADRVRAVANVLNTQHRAIVLGDFNLQHGDPAMQRWFQGFWYSANPAARPTHDRLGVLDYIMGRADRFSFGHAAYISAVDGSDHHLMQGYPVFK
jgi:hypothetical protein